MAFLSSRALAVGAAAAAVAVLSAAWAYRCPTAAVRGSVVLITGASSGIGEEMAYQYGKLGARLVLAARRAAELDRVAAGARAAGSPAVTVVPTDMGSPGAVEALVGAAVAAHGRLDTLVLNHAAFDDALFLSHNASTLEDRVMFQTRVNVLGSAVAARAALPHLEASGGHIAVVSSGTAKLSAPFHAVYASTKKALHAMFDSLRHELHLIDR
jgi:short-subunit dehydrogenase